MGFRKAAGLDTDWCPWYDWKWGMSKLKKAGRYSSGGSGFSLGLTTDDLLKVIQRDTPARTKSCTQGGAFPVIATETSARPAQTRPSPRQALSQSDLRRPLLPRRPA